MATAPAPSEEVTAAIQVVLLWMVEKNINTIRLTALNASGDVVIVVAAATGDKCDDLMARTDGLGRDGG